MKNLDTTVFDDVAEYATQISVGGMLQGAAADNYLISFVITDFKYSRLLCAGFPAREVTYAYRYEKGTGIDKGFPIEHFSRITDPQSEMLLTGAVSDFDSLVLKNCLFSDLDMVLLDACCDEASAKNALSLLRIGGISIFWLDSPVARSTFYAEYARKYYLLFKNDSIALFRHQEQVFEPREMFWQGRIENVYRRTTELGRDAAHALPRVCAAIISYQQEDYIVQCLESIVKQEGQFALHVYLCDDASQDGTATAAENYLSQVKRENFSYEVIRHEENIGLVQNYKYCFGKASAFDFVATCDGDDYFNDFQKIQKHLVFLQQNPRCIASFNCLQMYWQDENRFEKHDYSCIGKSNYLDTAQLVDNNIIGTFSTCFYRGEAMRDLSDSLFEMFTVDWMFNIYAQRLGDIGIIKEYMSVYRKHQKAVWSSEDGASQTIKLHDLVQQYNAFLGYVLDYEFEMFLHKLCIYESYDLVIIDDVFPSDKSSFRFQEFTSYLAEIGKTRIYCDGRGFFFFGDAGYREYAPAFKQEYPQYATSITSNTWMYCNPKLLYFVFLNNAFRHMAHAEAVNIPFVFTLYPGGGLALNDPESDEKLRCVFASPSFRGVIVTQQVVYNYLLDNALCSPDDIHFIFGVVTPLPLLEASELVKERPYWSDGKDTMDLCFVAYRYTSLGEDKGYDIFVEAAKQLCRSADNIKFHVVGNFDETVIELGEAKPFFSFHGVQSQAWLAQFYEGMDMIISPNISNRISSGTFDGFPTSCCTEAALKGVMIVCTDELNQNQGYFNDGGDIVVVPHSAEEVVERVLHYYAHPDQLARIAKAGRKKTAKLYSYEKQILPRIELLKKQISMSDGANGQKWLKLSTAYETSPQDKVPEVVISSWIHNLFQDKLGNFGINLLNFLKKYLPMSVKQLGKKLIKKHIRGNR